VTENTIPSQGTESRSERPPDAPSPEDAARYETIISFVQSLQAVDELPPGKYAMWWAAEDGERFQDSPCFQAWDDAYHTLDGIESYVLGMLIGAIHPDAVEGPRVKYPPTPLRFLVEGPKQEPLVLSLDQEKGIRFHFNAERCEPEYRDLFVASFAAFAQALRTHIEQGASELDPAWEPRALDWWTRMKLTLAILEKEQKKPARLVGFIPIGDREG
jgi:hypothetical protein